MYGLNVGIPDLDPKQTDKLASLMLDINVLIVPLHLSLCIFGPVLFLLPLHFGKLKWLPPKIKLKYMNMFLNSRNETIPESGNGSWYFHWTRIVVGVKLSGVCLWG